MKNLFITPMLIVLILAMSLPLLSQDWQYLGQTPPDSIPVRFGTSAYLSNAAWWWHGSPTFAPDGKSMYFSKYLAEDAIEIWFTKYENNQWTAPVRAPFSNANSTDNNPSFKGNDTLFFYSSRSNNYRFIYRVTRNNDSEWSQPIGIALQVPSQYYTGSQFSVARNGNIYAELEAPPYNNRDLYLYKLLTNGQYAAPEKISLICSESLEFTPFVDPAERYIIFSSGRPGGFGDMDLYISYKNQDDSWSIPQNMGATINSPFATFPVVTPDGKYLFFNTQKNGDPIYNAYWVKTDKFINPVEIHSVDKKSLDGCELFQNYPNPFNPTTTIKFSLLKKQFASINIYDRKGALVVKLGRRIYSAGLHDVEFNCQYLSSGQYFYQLNTGGFTTTKRMLLVK